MEVSEQRLEVCLVPGNRPEVVEDGRMIRAAYSVNPDWYQELCESYPCTRRKKRNARKDWTKVKRAYTIKVLNRMIRNQKSTSVYAEYLLDVAKSRHERFDTPWNNQF